MCEERRRLTSLYTNATARLIEATERLSESILMPGDDFNTALQKKWILSKGVSCHSLPALRTSISSDWTQVHLVRVNPQGIRIDNEQQVSWAGGINDINPVLVELKKMKEKKRGVIGMKIFGNGEMHTDADREKSVRFAMSLPEIDAVIIGFADVEQLDKGIQLVNTVLASM